MNFLNPLSRTRFSNGDAKVRFIFKSPNFFETFFKKFFGDRFSVSIRKNSALSDTRFSNGIAKVDIFSLPPNKSVSIKGTKNVRRTTIR